MNALQRRLMDAKKIEQFIDFTHKLETPANKAVLEAVRQGFILTEAGDLKTRVKDLLSKGLSKFKVAAMLGISSAMVGYLAAQAFDQETGLDSDLYNIDKHMQVDEHTLQGQHGWNPVSMPAGNGSVVGDHYNDHSLEELGINPKTTHVTVSPDGSCMYKPISGKMYRLG